MVLKYENGRVFNDLDVYKKIETKEVKRIFITMSRSGDYFLHIDDKMGRIFGGYIMTIIDGENYDELVGIIKEIYKNNQEINLMKGVKKMIENEGENVMKKKFFFAKIYRGFIYSLLILWLVSVIFGFVFN